MSLRSEIDALLAHGRRGPGTDAERRAANHLRGRLEALGREAHVEPIVVRPEWTQVLILHALLAVAASLASVVVPAVATILAFAALSSALAYLTGLATFGAALSPRRASQNVVSAERTGKPGTLFLLAHYDSSRNGGLLARALRPVEAVSGWLRIGPGGLFVLALFVLFACCGLRSLGIAGPALAAVQFIPTSLLLLGSAALADGRAASFVSGANDNASGVALALALTQRFNDRLEHFDLAVLFTGAHEGLALGARAWVKRHRRGFDKRSTIFLNLDAVGAGDPVFAVREGLVLPSATNSTLREICASLDGPTNGSPARRITRAVPSDAAALRERGYPALTLTAVDRRGRNPHRHLLSDVAHEIDGQALRRSEQLAVALIERIDAEIGPRLAAAATPR